MDTDIKRQALLAQRAGYRWAQQHPEEDVEAAERAGEEQFRCSGSWLVSYAFKQGVAMAKASEQREARIADR